MRQLLVFFWIALVAIASPNSLAELEDTILRASDGVQPDNFGNSVDIDGSLMVVGAYFATVNNDSSRGAAYLFENDGSGNWSEIKKMIAPDGLAFHHFGKAVAIDGDTVVIGAIGVDVGANISEGAAYVFQRDFGGTDNWGMVKRLNASTNIQSLGEFGGAVAIDGDTIVVGARTAFSQAHGGAFVYDRDQGGTDNWGVVQDLVDDVFDSNASFGVSVGISGDVMVIGAESLDLVPGSFNNEGGIYVFTRTAGVWAQSAKIFASNADGSAHFGNRVAIDGTRISASAPFHALNGNFSVGQAYVIDKNGPGDGDWTETAILSAGDGSGFNYFGYGLALYGDTVIAGATGFSGVGQGYRFDLVGSSWTETATYSASDAVSGDSLGRFAAIAPGVVALGSPLGDAGAIYLYPSASGPSGPGSIPAASLSLEKVAASSNLALSWNASCATNGVDYAIFEGELGNWYSHTTVTCSDSAGDLTEELAPAAGDRYYLVVPISTTDEGSYGVDSNGLSRPVGFATCRTTQIVDVCP